MLAVLGEECFEECFDSVLEFYSVFCLTVHKLNVSGFSVCSACVGANNEPLHFIRGLRYYGV